MKTIIVKKEIYSFPELSEKAKEKAIQDFIATGIRDEDFYEGLKYYARETFGDEVSVQMCLSSCQGDGINVYGDIDIEKILSENKDFFAEKEYKALTWYNKQGYLVISLPYNRRYCYCMADQLDGGADIADDISCRYSLRDINISAIEKLRDLIVDKAEEFCRKNEKDGYDFICEIPEEEFSEMAEANGWEFLEDGTLY